MDTGRKHVVVQDSTVEGKEDRCDVDTVRTGVT